MKTTIIISSLLLTLAFSEGCTRRVYVQPPPPRVEVIPAAPPGRHVWIKGHYVRHGRNYVWHNGYYSRRRH